MHVERWNIVTVIIIMCSDGIHPPPPPTHTQSYRSSLPVHTTVVHLFLRWCDIRYYWAQTGKWRLAQHNLSYYSSVSCHPNIMQIFTSFSGVAWERVYLDCTGTVLYAHMQCDPALYIPFSESFPGFPLRIVWERVVMAENGPVIYGLEFQVCVCV